MGGAMNWLLCKCCCGRSEQPRSSRPKRERRHRRHRRHHAAAAQPPSRQGTHRSELGPGTPLAATSVASESEYHDARDAWSVTDGEHSPLSSAQPHGDEDYQDFTEGEGSGSSSSGSGSESGSDASQSSTGFGAKLVSCLSIIRASSAGEDEGHPRMHHQHAGARPHRLPATCTFARRSPNTPPDASSSCWDECEASHFQIRSQDYAQSKVKQASSKAIYRLVGMDLFATDTKAYHVAKSFALPQTGQPVVCKPSVPGGQEVVLPPLLIMNVQLPDYPAAFWGTSDGPGQSIVHYYQLREDFDPEKFENQAALGLLQRFVSNGREADGSPTRDRLKLIVRVANLEEWARVAPLSATEYRLLQNYNEKPVLTRPQHAFHVGPNYLEVDLDVHNYAFLARKALWSYHDRLPTVVWDMGFVIQGNCPEELPEQILGCGRIYRTDFRRFPFLSDVTSGSSSSTPAAPGTLAGSGSQTPSRGSFSAGRPASLTARAGGTSAAAAASDGAAVAAAAPGASAAGGDAAAAAAAAGAQAARDKAAAAGAGGAAAVVGPGAAAAAAAGAKQSGDGEVPTGGSSVGSGAADASVLLPNGPAASLPDAHAAEAGAGGAATTAAATSSSAGGTGVAQPQRRQQQQQQQQQHDKEGEQH